jgi:hypothetical protein
MRLTFTGYPNSASGGLAHRAGSRAGRVRVFASRATDCSLNGDRIPVAHEPFEQGPAAAPFPSGMVRRLSKPQFRVEYERTGVVTSSDPIKRPLRLPRRSTDGPTAQVPNAVTTTLNNHHKACGRTQMRDDEECRHLLQMPGQFRPADREPRPNVQHGAESRSYIRDPRQRWRRARTRQRTRRNFSCTLKRNARTKTGIKTNEHCRSND